MKLLPFDIWYRLGRVAARIFLPTFGSVEVVGRSRVPQDGPLIVAANHQSFSDPPLLVYAISRPLFFLAKRGLFTGPLVSLALRMWHAYPVKEDGKAPDSLRWAQQTLSAGRALLVFPEGKRNPGALGEASDGLTYLALRSGAPILPVGITGTEKAPTLLRIPFHFQRLKVVMGEPFHLPTVTGRVDRAQLRETTRLIMTRIAELLPPEYRGFYADCVRADEAGSSEASQAGEGDCPPVEGAPSAHGEPTPAPGG